MSRSFNDPTGRGPTAAALAVWGTVYLAVIVLITVLLLMRSTGAFHSSVPATAVVASVGDGLNSGADVKMRGVLVGSVGEVESELAGSRHVVHLRLKPEYAQGIPNSVKARIIPTNIFGQPSVDLVAAAGDSTPLQAGAVIPGDDSQEALQLQSAISNLHRLLTTVEPSKLNATLAGIKQALDGRGRQIGGIIDRLDAYLGKLNPSSPRFAGLLTKAGTALEGLEDSAPDLLDTVDDLLTTSKTVADKRHQLAATLTGADELLTTVDGFLERNAEQVITVLHGSRSVVSALAADADAIPRSFRALDKGAGALVAVFAENSGRLDIDTRFTMEPFDPYTSADCPRYPGLDGPNCAQPAGSGDSSRPQTGPSRFGGTVGPVGSQHEREQLTDIFGDELSGSSLDSLLLGPLVRGTTVVIPR